MGNQAVWWLNVLLGVANFGISQAPGAKWWSRFLSLSVGVLAFVYGFVHLMLFYKWGL